VRELLADLDRWLSEGRRVALATLIAVEGSGPRAPGAALAVSDAGEVSGSVSGGCVEGAVVEAALSVLDGSPPHVVRFAAADAAGLEPGLPCGGALRIFVAELRGERDGAPFALVRDAVRAAAPVALCTVLEGAHAGATLAAAADGETRGTLGDAELDRAVTRDARALLAQGLTRLRRYGGRGQTREAGVEVFVASFASPPTLVLCGAIDFTASLCRIGKVLGYRVVICDARAAFATPARFPEADEVVVEWPDRYLAKADLDERSAIAVLTHDPKFDVPALQAAVKTPAAYVGAMGSRLTHRDRVERLREAGMSEAEIARISAPAGLDLGAATPEETALSILAEVVALRSGHRGGRLSEGAGPIHSRAATR
jgi:xanthine dehydrogenase accessory factor